MINYLDNHKNNRKVVFYLLPPLIFLAVRLLITILDHLKYQAYDTLFYTGLLGIYGLGIVTICYLTDRKGYGSMLSHCHSNGGTL